MLEKIKTIKQKFGIVGNSTPLNHAIEVAASRGLQQRPARPALCPGTTH